MLRYDASVKHLTFSERQYFQKYFPEVHLSSIGGLVGMGAQSVVRAYEMQGGVSPMVIKYPRARTRSDFFSMGVSPIFTQPARQISEQVGLCQQYFKDRVIFTELVADLKRGKNFYMIQERLSMKVLTLDLYRKHPELEPQLHEVLRENRKLMNDTGLWFDFMGWDSKRVLRDEAYIANLGVVGTPHDGMRLKMFDLSLYVLPRYSPNTWLHGILYAVQSRNLRRFGCDF